MPHYIVALSSVVSKVNGAAVGKEVEVVVVKFLALHTVELFIVSTLVSMRVLLNRKQVATLNKWSVEVSAGIIVEVRHFVRFIVVIVLRFDDRELRVVED